MQAVLRPNDVQTVPLEAPFSEPDALHYEVCDAIRLDTLPRLEGLRLLGLKSAGRLPADQVQGPACEIGGWSG